LYNVSTYDGNSNDDDDDNNTSSGGGGGGDRLTHSSHYRYLRDQVNQLVPRSIRYFDNSTNSIQPLYLYLQPSHRTDTTTGSNSATMEAAATGTLDRSSHTTATTTTETRKVDSTTTARQERTLFALPSLQIGCSSWKTCVRPGFLIADAVANVTTHFVTLAYSLPMIATGSIGLVYSSHTLEHLSYNLPPHATCAQYPQSDETIPGCANEVDTALQEWRRVLVAGGQLLVGVPDLHILLANFVNSTSVKEKNSISTLLYGGHENPYDIHLTGFYYEYLKFFLEKNSFCNVTRVRYFGLFRDSSGLEFRDSSGGDSLSLNLHAVAC
jgi:predicted SAM-dependent methyltransferase